jgi:L-rhamnose mutarotase
MTQLVALHSGLRAGSEADYDAVHERIPGELIEAHRRVGIHDWRIWRSGRNLFHLAECDDFRAAIRELEHEPANERCCRSSGACAIRQAVRPADAIQPRLKCAAVAKSAYQNGFPASRSLRQMRL